MPYNSVADVPDYVPTAHRAQWRAVWNSSYKRLKAQGKSDKDAESGAFARASGVVKKQSSESTPKEREKMDPGDFAGPHRSFPIKDQSDVHDAARLVGKAANPAAVKARIIAIAKKKGFDLPESWKNGEKAPPTDIYSPTLEIELQDAGKRSADEPGGDSMHVNAPIGRVPPVGPSRHFLTKFMSHVRQRAGEKGWLTANDVTEALRRARASAGGKAKAAKLSAGSQVVGVRVMFEPWSQEPVGAYVDDSALPDDDDDDEGEEAEDEAMLEGPRLAKADPAVKYRMAEKPNQHCGDCRFFVPDWDCDGDPQCRLVEGLIEPSFVCDLFRPPVDLGYAARAAGELADLCSDHKESSFRLFMELPTLDAAMPPEWVNMLPVPGIYTHQRWGPVTITPERNARFVDNFKRAVYQEQLPIDAEHETKLSGATSWIRDLRQNSDGSVDARMEWTPRGKQFLAQKAFRYVSPEWYDEWVDPATGQTHSDVLIGGALTTRPFFKERSLRPMIANERGLSVLRGSLDQFKEDPEALVFTTLERRDFSVADQKKPAPPASDDDADDAAKKATEDAARAASEDARVPAPATDKRITMSEEDYRAFTEMRSQLDSLRQANEVKDAELKKATENIAQMRADERRQRFTEEITGKSAANGAPWAGDHTKVLGVMETLANQFGEDSDVFKDYVTASRAAAAQLKDSAIFREIGKGGTRSFADASPLGRIDALAKAYREEHPEVTIEKARTMVMTENPELYDEYVEQRPTR